MDVYIPCICPPKDGQSRHERDTISLRDTLDFRQAITVRNEALVTRAADPDVSTAEIMAAMTEAYLVAGVTHWSLVDDRNKSVEVSKAAIRSLLLPSFEAATIVADAADELYREKVILPLLQPASSYSPPTLTAAGTSPTNDTPSKHPRPRSRSSTSTTRTDGIGTTSALHAGASSSSPS